MHVRNTVFKGALAILGSSIALAEGTNSPANGTNEVAARPFVWVAPRLAANERLWTNWHNEIRAGQAMRWQSIVLETVEGGVVVSQREVHRTHKEIIPLDQMRIYTNSWVGGKAQ